MLWRQYRDEPARDLGDSAPTITSTCSRPSALVIASAARSFPSVIRTFTDLIAPRDCPSATVPHISYNEPGIGLDLRHFYWDLGVAAALDDTLVYDGNELPSHLRLATSIGFGF